MLPKSLVQEQSSRPPHRATPCGKTRRMMYRVLRLGRPFSAQLYPSSNPKIQCCTMLFWHSHKCPFLMGHLFCSLAFLDPKVGHTMDVLSPFISILCHSDWLFHREACPWLDVVYPGRAWSSSPACTWHCSLQYFFLQAIPLFPHGVTIV